ncbi:hypothetical protein MNAN1_001956 [Malassezia nana]|uniref:N-acetyl-D-glucosamine kinase n=1 Tax=Malassezia nana TaxID=180528 RepID=A0AAF0EI57_9BASI|nr:hypothetical protein MNAN1_001956 [Malassezia nana]
MYLAVDAGGSHTRATLVDGAGRVRGRGETGPANWAVQGADVWIEAIRASVVGVCASLGGLRPDDAHVWVGAAGLPACGQDEAARALLTQLFRGAHLRVTNDAVLLHRSSQRRCIVAIAGTGSVVLLIHADGTVERQWGGLGWLLGDEGSAFSLGRAAVRAILEAPSAAHPLRARVVQALSCPPHTDLATHIYAAPDPRTLLASLAPCVTAAAAAGEQDALALVQEEAAHLASHMARAAAAVHPDKADVRLGGALMQVPCFQQALFAHLARLGVSMASVEVVAEPSEYAAQTLRLLSA